MASLAKVTKAKRKIKKDKILKKRSVKSRKKIEKLRAEGRLV